MDRDDTNLKVSVEKLNEALQSGDMPQFLEILKEIALRNGGISQIAKETTLNRESLYRTLSSDGNPRLTSLLAILYACQLDISIKPLQE